jgi:hypothetical protein
VVCWQMVFGEIVCKIVCTFSSMDDELTLFDAVIYPIKAHANCLGSSLFDGFVGHACCTCIVCLNGCGWLWVAHFDKVGAKWYAVSCVVKQSSKFGFHGGSHDVSHDGTDDVDGSILGWWDGVGRWRFGGVSRARTEEEITASATART